jgi:micrococcal nuclease
MLDQIYHYKVNVVSVYDGDSVTVDIDLGFNNWMKKQKLRLYGIDTPEIRGEERPDGLISKARLIELLEDKTVVIKSHKDKSGKYGRWLATLFIEEDNDEYTNINELLITEGLAEQYK